MNYFLLHKRQNSPLRLFFFWIDVLDELVLPVELIFPFRFFGVLWLWFSQSLLGIEFTSQTWGELEGGCVSPNHPLLTSLRLGGGIHRFNRLNYYKINNNHAKIFI